MTDSAAAELARLADAYWAESLAADPLMATTIGVREHDAELPLVTEAEMEARARELRAQRGAVRAVDPAALSADDAVTHAALLDAIDGELAFAVADTRAFTVDPMSGPQVAMLSIPDYHLVSTVAQGRDMAARWRAIGPWVDALRERQAASIRNGRPPVRVLVDRAIDELDGLLAQDEAEWPLLQPARTAHAGWSDAETRAFGHEIGSAVTDGCGRPSSATVPSWPTRRCPLGAVTARSDWRRWREASRCIGPLRGRTRRRTSHRRSSMRWGSPRSSASTRNCARWAARCSARGICRTRCAACAPIPSSISPAARRSSRWRAPALLARMPPRRTGSTSFPTRHARSCRCRRTRKSTRRSPTTGIPPPTAPGPASTT